MKKKWKQFENIFFSREVTSLRQEKIGEKNEFLMVTVVVLNSG